MSRTEVKPPLPTNSKGEAAEGKAPKSETKSGNRQRHLAGFAGARGEHGFTIHIIDDDGEVFEILASRENLEAMVVNLQQLIETGSAEDAHAQG